MLRRGAIRCCYKSKVASMGTAAGSRVLQQVAESATTAAAKSPVNAPCVHPAGPFKDARRFSDEAAMKDAPSVDALRKRLQFQSRYRGMWELDMILGAFSADCVASLASEASFPVDESMRVAAEELPLYDAILREFDNDLNHWLVDVAVHNLSEGLPVPLEDPSATPTESLRGAIPTRLDANPVWHKLVLYVVQCRDRIQQYR
jgi:succinate dehydrogenase flavin-adding protein (antitoxin of CptAB toxin-antitoxin module)